jgi:hypothetical protein
MADKKVKANENIIKFKRDRQEYKEMQVMLQKNYPNKHKNRL